MKQNKNSSPNKKALPKFFGILLLSMLCGGLMGFMGGFFGAANLSERITDSIYRFLEAFMPWSIWITGILLLGAALVQYRAGRALVHCWDGEDEAVIEQAEEKLSWALLFTSLCLILAFFFFALSVGVVHAEHPLLLLASFILVMAGTMVLQQKVVDLERSINPEKQGSVYDIHFQKKWLASCDENEMRQVGQAAFKAFSAVNYTCPVFMLVLLVLSFSFDLGIMPFFAVTVIWAVLHLVYSLECIRLGRHDR